MLVAHLFLQHVPQSVLDVDDMLAVEQRNIDNYKYTANTTIKNHADVFVTTILHTIISNNSHILGYNDDDDDTHVMASFPNNYNQLDYCLASLVFSSLPAATICS